jgi:cobalt/nickel transport system permease protein
MTGLSLPWAVHISDGILDWRWLAAGFALTGALALVACWRVREEVIPRIALLTAAFFAASSIHVKLGPTSAHLLLNSLVGVILGWRAPLAVLIGVTLQALLIPHGGLSTIGVNALAETIPALLAGALFVLLRRAEADRGPWLRSLLAAASAVLWGGCLVFGVALLFTNPFRGLVRWHQSAGLVISLDNFEPARKALLHPMTLLGLGAFALACVVLERRRHTSPEFPLGVFLGVLSVLATVSLTGLVLVADGAERWGVFVSTVFVLHLPIALLEGLILGCTLGFLARVKPEILGEDSARPLACASGPGVSAKVLPIQQQTGLMMLLALGATLLFTTPARAHRLLAECRSVDRTKQQVRIESWYETDALPENATARVLREDGSVLAEGPLDGEGAFVFAFTRAEPLTVRITAPGGHAAEVKISAEELKGAAEKTEERDHPPAKKGPSTGESDRRVRDLLAGVGFLLALSAFVMSWLNGRKMRKLVERLERR